MTPISSSTCCIAFSFRIVGSFRFVGSCKGPPSRHKDGLAGVKMVLLITSKLIITAPPVGRTIIDFALYFG